MTVVPLCGGYWTTGPEREPVPTRRRRARRAGRGLMAPGLVDDAATQACARRARRRPRRSSTCGSGSTSPCSASAARPGARRSVGEDVAASSSRAGAVGEVLVAPFDLDGRFVCPALRERVIAFDARAPRPASRSRSASPRARARSRPILGALRAGVVRTLVTDVATAEAVVALDAATLTAPAATA